MANLKKDKEGNPVKFIRKNGKIIPIRAKSSQSSSTRDINKDINTIFKKHGKKPTTKQRIRKSLAMGTTIGTMTGLIGASVDVARKGKFGKTTAISAGIGAAIGAVAGSSDSPVVSSEKFVKEMKKISGKRKMANTGK